MPRPDSYSPWVGGPGGGPGSPRWHGWNGGPPPDSARVRRLTLWAPVVISFVVQVSFAAWIVRTEHLEPWEAALTIGLAAVGPLALIAARRFPGPVVAIAALAAAADLFLNDRGGPYLALVFAIVSAVVRGARLWAWISIGACWVGSLSLALLTGQAGWNPFRIAGSTLAILIALGIGEAIASRRERARQFQREMAERRQTEVQAERVRIARELHDVLAHSLSQINVQAGVGLHLIDTQPEQAASALASIKQTSKTALDEVRSVLGFLRSDGTDPDAPLVPEPTIERIPELVASSAHPGLEVDLVDELDATEVPQPTQLAAYRIVQESLTNIARHARGASRVLVSLTRSGDSYVVEVTDDGEAGAASAVPGRGLLGMRERAELLGGRLTAAPIDGAPGFRVRAELPAPHSAPGRSR